MIRITDTGHGIRVVGHAGPPPDLICEDVTVLIINLINSIRILTDDDIEADVQSGYAAITYEDPSEQARLLIESFFVGVSAVANAHPDKVQVSRPDDMKS